MTEAHYHLFLPLVICNNRSAPPELLLAVHPLAIWAGLFLLGILLILPKAWLRLRSVDRWLQVVTSSLRRWHLNWLIVLGLVLAGLRLGIALGYPEGIPGLWAFQDAKTKQILTVTLLWCLVSGFMVRIVERREGPVRLLNSALRRLELRSRRLLWLAVGLFVVAYGAFVIARHEMFNSTGFDLAIYEQVIWNTAHGRWFAQSIEVANRLGDHFQPLLVVVAALYRLAPSIATILLFQTFVLAAGAIPVYNLAQRRLNSHAAGLTFSLVYLLYPAIGFIERFDFHFEIIGIPLLLLAYDLEDRGHLEWASLCLALSLSAKEQFGLAVAALGLMALLQRKRWRFGLAWTIIGVTWSLLVPLLVMPHFRGGNLPDSFHWYDWLGTTPSDMVRNALLHPDLVLGKMLQGRRLFSLLQLTFPLAFLPLLDPAPLILFVPLFAMNLLSNCPAQFQIYCQYTAPVIPVLFIAGIGGGRKLLRSHQAKIIGYFPGASRVWSTITLIAMAVAAFLIDNPFTHANVLANIRHSLPNRSTVREALAYVPSDASVVATNPYAPHLSQREELHIIGWLDPGWRDDVFFLNLLDERWGDRETYEEYVKRLAEEDYGIIFQRHGVLVIQRGAGSHEALVILAEHWPGFLCVLDDVGTLPFEVTPEGEPAFLIEHPLEANLGDKVEFLGYWLSADRIKAGGSLKLILFWRAGAEMELDYSVFTHLLDPDGHIHSQQDNYPQRGKHPTSCWTPGEIVPGSYVLPVSQEASAGEYQIEVGMYDWRTGRRLPTFNSHGERLPQDRILLQSVQVVR